MVNKKMDLENDLCRELHDKNRRKKDFSMRIIPHIS